MTWSISVKRVGSGDTSTSAPSAFKNPNGHVPAALLAPEAAAPDEPTTKIAGTMKHSESTKEQQPSTFTIHVNPDSPLSELHTSIEAVTGLKASQQRLIYRGRIIPQGTEEQAAENGENQMRICDVNGLSDGHTIHLFPRRNDVAATPPTVPQNSAPATGNTNNANEPPSQQDQDRAQTTASSLLSALLGIRSGFSVGNTGNLTVISSSNNDGTGGLPDALANFAGLSSLSRSSRALQRANAARASFTTTRNAISTGPRIGGNSAANRRQRGYRDGVPPVRDPGSMETIRQGLMTLHTMLGAQHRSGEDAVAARPNRTFYKGQWIDVKDTVNQWLEATVLEVATPEDVLGEDAHLLTEPSEVALGSTIVEQESSTSRGSFCGFPVVSMNDMEGRRSLLLRSIVVSSDGCAEVMDLSSTESTGAAEDAATKTIEVPHANSADVQVLLVHYNGWPHRWDEWIRSDSPRIRAFRTRTRHSSSLPFLSPSIHSVFADSPSTHIVSKDDEQLERVAVLPEVARVLSDVQVVLNDVARGLPSLSQEQKDQQARGASEEEKEETKELDPIMQPDDDDAEYNSVIAELSAYQRPCLPWQTVVGDSSVARESAKPATAALKSDGCDDDVSSSHVPAPATRADVQALAALFDRLGRTLTDLAPHVAALATTFPDANASSSRETAGSRGLEQASEENDTTATEASGSRGTEQEATNSVVTPVDGVSHGVPILVPPFPDLPPLYASAGTAPTPVAPPAPSSTAVSAAQQQPRLPNDNVDFVNGMVHTRLTSSSGSTFTSGVNGGTRVVRSGRDRAAAIASFLTESGGGGGESFSSSVSGFAVGGSSVAGDNNGAAEGVDGDEDGTTSDTNAVASDGSSFPENLARLLAAGGSDGGGIDIHIHAIVTPGFLPGGMLFGGLPSGILPGTTTTANAPSASTSVSETVASGPLRRVQNDDDSGLFDDLYGEPAPEPSLEDDVDMATPLLRHDASANSDSADLLVDENSVRRDVGQASGPANLEDSSDSASEESGITATLLERSSEDSDESNLRENIDSEGEEEDTTTDVVNDGLDTPSPEVGSLPDGEGDTDNNDSGTGRRDLLSVLRRYTLGRGPR